MDYVPENRLGMKSNNPFEGYDEIKKQGAQMYKGNRA
jgi:hypothetical protein